ncbi:MAG: PD-(D/E)XK nuclease family protein [Betaproteobacteria bacterium]|nr:PD-(D/E)XK nuclease family protein [Betaproteobacteria bacterium]
MNALIENAPIREIESVLTEPAAKGRTAAVPFKPRRERRRWWFLPKGTKIPGPEHESFSSLEQLIFDPNRWVLGYAARIRPSSLLELPGESQLLGQLAHRVVERLYLTPGSLDWDEGKVAAWVDACLDDVVAEEGAILLMPGRRSDLEALRQRLRKAVVDLHARLRRTGAVRVVPEKHLEGDTALGKLKGFIDLHVEHEAGPTSVVDMKWGKSAYAKKVVEKKHIQLAIYGKLVEIETGRWPAVAYYILRDRDLLTRDDELFAGQRGAATAGDTSELWEQVVTRGAGAGLQLDAGAIEVVREDLEPDDGVKGPPSAFAIEPLYQAYNRYRFLDGWGRANEREDPLHQRRRG